MSELDVTAIVFDEEVNAEVDLDGTMSVEVYLGVVPSSEGVGSGVVTDHDDLTGRTAADQHPIGAITGLQTALDGKATSAQGAKADTALQPGVGLVSTDPGNAATLGADDLVYVPPSEGGPPALIRVANYGSGGGTGWGFYQHNFRANASIAGTHSGGTVSGAATSAASVSAVASYGWQWMNLDSPGTVITIRFALQNLTDTRNWAGYMAGVADAALPWSNAYNSSAALALRGSPFDGDTTFKFYTLGVLTDTGVPIDTNFHEFRIENMGDGTYQLSLDGGAPLTTAQVTIGYQSVQLTSITQTAAATSIRLAGITISELAYRGFEHYDA